MALNLKYVLPTRPVNLVLFQIQHDAAYKNLLAFRGIYTLCSDPPRNLRSAPHKIHLLPEVKRTWIDKLRTLLFAEEEEAA